MIIVSNRVLMFSGIRISDEPVPEVWRRIDIDDDIDAVVIIAWEAARSSDEFDTVPRHELSLQIPIRCFDNNVHQSTDGVVRSAYMIGTSEPTYQSFRCEGRFRIAERSLYAGACIGAIDLTFTAPVLDMWRDGNTKVRLALG